MAAYLIVTHDIVNVVHAVSQRNEKKKLFAAANIQNFKDDMVIYVTSPSTGVKEGIYLVLKLPTPQSGAEP